MSGVLEHSHAMMSAVLGDSNASELMNAIHLAIRGREFAATSRFTEPLGQAVYDMVSKFLEIKNDTFPAGPVWDDHKD